ncbi:MAG: 2TM domain-containing protein [Acidimicrobiia bacterium]|nr:2TM domain-containing protein [Acidimicrobiia bacterium]
MATTETKTTPETRAEERSNAFAGVVWHAVVFALLNAGLWLLDARQGSAFDWAFWVTIFTGLALVFHITWYVLEQSGRQSRRYQRFLDQERER